MVSKLNIEEFLTRSQNHPVLDVRSPGEFDHAHIPGAISLPLFSNEERAIIGTIYKQKGREPAMMKGLEFYSASMQRIIDDLKNRTDDKQLFVHCWRGGMRSGVVAWMLDLFGYKVSTLNKGYKSFRSWVLTSFSQPRNIVILGGKTGSGKTEVLQELKKSGEQIIDLEKFAHHKGSAFGDLGEAPPPTQEQFENDLAMEFFRLDLSKNIWLEDESQRIGWINVPNSLWNQMREAKVFYLDVPFEERLKNIISLYGKFNPENLKAATLRISKRLGGLDTKNVLQFLEEGKIKEAFSILLAYYDKAYLKATEQRSAEQIVTIPISKVYSIEAASIVSKISAAASSPMGV